MTKLFFQGFSGTVALYCQIPDDIFCKNESNTCVRFCCPPGMYYNDKLPNDPCVPYRNKDKSEWKPKALSDAEVKGTARALYHRYPDCDHHLIEESHKSPFPFKILNNGSVDWGMLINIHKGCPGSMMMHF